MEYITFMRNNTTSPIQDAEWKKYFDFLNACTAFRGGSELGKNVLIGNPDILPVTQHLGGFMRFDVENREELETILSNHPVIKHGGSIEICEMPEQ